MKIPPRATRIGAAAALLSALLMGGTVSAAPAGAAATAVGSISYSDLPSQAYTTLNVLDDPDALATHGTLLAQAPRLVGQLIQG